MLDQSITWEAKDWGLVRRSGGDGGRVGGGNIQKGTSFQRGGEKDKEIEREE